MENGTSVYTLNNILEVRDKIAELERNRYHKKNIHVLAHDNKRTEHIAKHTDSNEIGVLDEGILTAIANVFRSKGDELRAKLQSMGVSKVHAELLEREMDKGKIVLLAWSGTYYDGENYDEGIIYSPPFL